MPAKNLKKHIREAMQGNDIQRAILLLSNHPSVINENVHDGKSALHLAVETNKPTLVKYILGMPNLNVNLRTVKGKTAVYLASANPKISIDILKLLLKKNADPGIADETGETPLTAASWSQDTAKCEALLKAGQCNPEAACETYGSTALTNAVTKKQIIIAKLIIAKIDVKIINHKNKNGESALFIAAKLGLVEVVAALIKVPGVDFDAFRAIADGKTAAQIAIDSGYKKIAEMINNQKLIVEKKMLARNMLRLSDHVDTGPLLRDPIANTDLKLDDKVQQPKKTSQLVTTYPSYTRYLQSLKKFPDRATFIRYTQELHEAALKAKAKPITVMPSERNETLSRQAWSDVISETDTENAKYIARNKVQAAVIKRLEDLGFNVNTSSIYQRCIEYLKHNSAIVVAFKAEFLKNGMQDFQLLNMFQRNVSRASCYTKDRDDTERAMFSYLSADLQKKFLDHPAARPKYGALVLLDRNQPVAPVVHYGKSFIVLKDVIKFNSLFSPFDSLDSKTERGVDVVPCTYHHFDILLHQCYDKFLHAIATRVTTGLLPDDFHQQVHTVDIKEGCYVEVSLQSIDVFARDHIEHIHIDPNEYTLSKEEATALNQMGLIVTNLKENPYLKIAQHFMGFIEKNDVLNVKKYLKMSPSLVHISNRVGLEPLHIAALNGHNELVKVLLDHGANVNALAPNGKAALHIAIEMKNRDLVALLLTRRDIDINIRMKIPGDVLDGAAPIHLACIHHVGIFKLLVKRKADIRTCTASGMSVLMLTPFVEAVDAMLSTPAATIINHKNLKGETALFIAASKGEVIKVGALLKFPHIDAKNKQAAAEIARKNKHHHSAFLITNHTNIKPALDAKTQPASDTSKIKLVILKKEFNKEFNNPFVFQNDFIKNIIRMFKLFEHSLDIKKPAEIILGFILTECANHKGSRSMFHAPLLLVKKLEQVKLNYIKELKSQHPGSTLLTDLDYINIYKAYAKSETSNKAAPKRATMSKPSRH